MGAPAAKQLDSVEAIDSHYLVPPNGSAFLAPLPFRAPLTTSLWPDVRVEGLPAATVGSGGTNTPIHVAPPSTTFAVPPSNQTTVVQGSRSVFVHGQPFARHGDRAQTCNDQAPLDRGVIQSTTTSVMVGG